MDKEQIKKFFTQVLGVEIKTVQDTLKDSQKDVSEGRIPESHIRDHMMMATSYLKGLERAQSIIFIAIDSCDETKH